MKAQRNAYLARPADEESSYTIKLRFLDEDGDPLAPTTLLWTLTTEAGIVVNGRYRQTVAVPAATTYVTLYGNDLQLVDKQVLYENRIFTYEGTYNSTYGNNLPIKGQIFFPVRNIILVAIALSIEVTDMVFTDDYVRDINA